MHSASPDHQCHKLINKARADVRKTTLRPAEGEKSLKRESLREVPVTFVATTEPFWTPGR